MVLNEQGIRDQRSLYQEKGYLLPEYDRNVMKERTKEHPEWIHFGAGNIFRAFQANLMQKLLNEGKADTGIIVCEGYDYEIIDKMYRPHDDLSILCTLKSDGTVEKTVIGSLAESHVLDREKTEEFQRLKTIMTSPSLRMAAFTITEKAYVVQKKEGEYLPGTEEEINRGTGSASS